MAALKLSRFGNSMEGFKNVQVIKGDAKATIAHENW
jgi:hypothetical protein